MPPARLLAVALAAALTVTGCSGGGDSAKKKNDAETSSAEFTHASVHLAVSGADLISPHQKLGPLDGDTAADVVAVVQQLLLVTSATPLIEGEPGHGLTPLFTRDAGARVVDHDRAVFFDDALPRFGTLRTLASRVKLTALAGSTDPAPALVIARYLWDVTSTAHPADRVTRDGELSLVKVAGTWKIGAYAISVTRSIDGTTTTTTATSTPSKKPTTTKATK